jgi:hypothetical protein
LKNEENSHSARCVRPWRIANYLLSKRKLGLSDKKVAHEQSSVDSYASLEKSTCQNPRKDESINSSPWIDEPLPPPPCYDVEQVN